MRAPFVVVLALAGCGGSVAPPPRKVEHVAPAPSAVAPAPSTVAEAPSAMPAKKPDADGDGISDDDDKCPNEPETYNGHEDEDGCPDGKVVIITSNPPVVERVWFAKGQKAPLPSAELLLAEVAKVMKTHPEIDLVQIEGHSEKSEPNGLKLSQARADAVKTSLVKKGVDAGRLRAKGFAAHCGAQAGADADRRAEFKVVTTNGKPSGVALGCPAASAAGIASD